MATGLFLLWACYPHPETETSAEQVPGVSDTEIRIGSSLALEGHAGYLGTQTLHGAMSYIHHINGEGGIHGRKIRIMAVDDGYDPDRCLVNTQKLILEDRVFGLFSYVGTPTTVKIIPLVEKAKIPLVGMFTGAHVLRDPLNRYLINIRASYYQEIDAGVERMVEDLGIRKVAVFYQYDDYGFDGLKGTELALRKYDLVPVARGTYIRGTNNVEEGLARIIQSEAEAVVMVGTYEPCARFIRKAREQGYHPLFFNVSFVGADELARRLGDSGEGVIVAQVVPPPEPPQSRDLMWGAAEYADLLRRYFPSDEPNFVGLEGYLNARVLVEGLRRAERKLTREGFIEAIETIQDYDLGIANTLSFSPTDHQGLERVYFTRLEEGRLSLITDWRHLRKSK